MRALGRGVLVYGSAALIVLYTAFPLYWLIATSLKQPVEVATWPPVLWPSKIDLGNYAAVLGSTLITRATVNSLIVAVSSTLIAVVVGTLAAYALAAQRLPARFRVLFIVWVLATRTFPPITTAIPYFILISGLGLADSLPGLILTYVSSALPFVIWLMLGFFQELPPEIEEAAIVDGASMLGRLRLVVLPLVAPGIAVAAMLVMITAWNEFLFASILTSSHAKTLPVILAGYTSNQFQRWGEMSALGSLMVVPVLIVAAAAQRSLIRGLTFGAVKG